MDTFLSTRAGWTPVVWQHDAVREWPGRAHVEGLRLWPDLAQTVDRIEARRELFLGALLLGSLSRGEGDAISDVDLVAVTHPDRWAQAWEARQLLSSGALVTFDRSEGKPEVAGHTWITPSLVKVECLIAAPGRMPLRGNAVVVAGEDDLPEAFERAAPFTPQEIDDYAARLRKTEAISEIERAYGDLIALLRRETRSTTEVERPPAPPAE